jgi:lipooligosaccharide transport system ATP-binding protein
VTLVITTHYMEEAAQLCDRLVIMHQGRILVEGSPADLIREHVAPDVIELTSGDPGTLHVLARETAPYASAHEVVGDRLVLHTDDGDAMLKVITDAEIAYETTTFRPATLEDVFLKLTGRRLEE